MNEDQKQFAQDIETFVDIYESKVSARNPRSRSREELIAELAELAAKAEAIKPTVDENDDEPNIMAKLNKAIATGKTRAKKKVFDCPAPKPAVSEHSSDEDEKAGIVRPIYV